MIMKKRFGQNFLRDKNLLMAIVKDAGVNAGDEVLEIGAGAGALTSALSACAKKVVSYEIDKDLIPDLEALQLNNVEFVFGDALKEDIQNIESKFDGEYRLVANLPYYITSPLIFKFLQESKKLTSMTIMVQKEVAERIVATEGKNYGVLSVMVAFFGKAEIKRYVDRKMFYPVPNVDSAIVRIDLDRNKFDDIDEINFSQLVKNAFSMRRKTLGNNLSKLYDRKVLIDTLGEKTLALRAENLNLDDFIELYKKLEK